MVNPVAHLNAYELHHLVAHLNASGRWVDIHALLGLEWEQAEEVLFLQRESKVRRQNAWYAAKEGSGDTNGYLADLDIARTLAESGGARRTARRTEAVALQCRYALIAAALRDLSRNHLPSLAARYIQAGVWTRDQALAWARLNPDQSQGLQEVVAALRQGKGEGLDELGRLALSTAATIPDSDMRVNSVADFFGDLPTHLLRPALEIVVKESNEGSRLGGLKFLVQKLPRDLQLEALEVAKRFESPQLKAEAIAVVAATLDEPQRTQAFQAAIAEAREAITQDQSNSTFLTQLATTLPLEWLSELLSLLEEEVLSSARQSVFAVYLERLVDRDPEWVWKQLADLPAWLRDDSLSRVAQVLASQGAIQKAMAATDEISGDVWGRRSEAIIAILKLAPESEWERGVELFGELSTEKRITALRKLAASSTVSASLLRRLTTSLTEEYDCLEARAAIARTLTATELDEMLNACAAHAGFPIRSRMTVDLAPYLSVAQTQRALDALEKPGVFELDGLKALVNHLADLGEPYEALHRINQLYGILESHRAEILAFLAPHLPDQYLPFLLASVRPTWVAYERVHTRAKLIPWLPPEMVDDIIFEASDLPDPLDRIRALSEIVEELPAKHLYNISKVLIASLQLVVTAQGNEWRQVMQQGFHALSQVLDRYPSAEIAEQAMALAQSEDLPSDEQVVLLVDLASVGGTASHVRAALAAAIQIAAQDSELDPILSEGLSADHKVVLIDLMGEQYDPWQLVVFLGMFAHLLDNTARYTAYQRISAVNDVQTRFVGLDVLLPYFGQHKRREAVITEMNRESEWSKEPETFVIAIAVLAQYAPLIVRPLIKNLVAVFGKLEPWTKVTLAGPLVGGTDFAHEILEEALTAVDDLPEPERPKAITQLAPLLDYLQIVHVMGWLRIHQDLNIASAIAGLIRRAAALDDAWLILKLLGVPENERSRSELIEETASELPLEALAPAAALIEDSPFEVLGALAVRAAQLGDMHLALHFLDQKGNNTFGGDRTLERVYRLAPNSWVNVLRERAEKLFPYKRATALLQLIDKIPRSKRRPLVESIVDSAASTQHGNLDVIYALEPELRQLPTSAIVSMWTDAMRHSSEEGRERVLAGVRAFAPTLVWHLGPEIALKLDQAICLASGEF
jgi:hypothetical protein